MRPIFSFSSFKCTSFRRYMLMVIIKWSIWNCQLKIKSSIFSIKTICFSILIKLLCIKGLIKISGKNISILITSIRIIQILDHMIHLDSYTSQDKIFSSNIMSEKVNVATYVVKACFRWYSRAEKDISFFLFRQLSVV